MPLSNLVPNDTHPSYDGGDGGGSSIWDGSHNAFVPAVHEFLGIAVVGLFVLYYGCNSIGWLPCTKAPSPPSPSPSPSPGSVAKRVRRRGSTRRFGSINDTEDPESGQFPSQHIPPPPPPRNTGAKRWAARAGMSRVSMAAARRGLTKISPRTPPVRSGCAGALAVICHCKFY